MDQDGELLCHCDRRKMQWYVHKGLADFVEGDDSTIKLKFRHKNSDKVDEYFCSLFHMFLFPFAASSV